ncbi:MAG: acyltransferase family protein [Chloroflexota bacterium]
MEHAGIVALCEAFFYASFPFLAPPLMRWGIRRSLLGIAVCCALGALLPVGLARLPEVGTFPLVRLPEFVIGILLARVYLLHRENAQLVKCGSWLAGGALAGILASTATTDDANIFIAAAAPALFGCLVVGLAVQGGSRSILASRPLVLLGEASYALYLVHLGLALELANLAQVLPQLAPVMSSGWFLLVYLAAAIALSLLIFIAVERPSRTVIRRALARPSQLRRSAEQSLGLT